MIIFILFLLNASHLIGQQVKVKLQGSTPIKMNCEDIDKIRNGFYGPQYFYDSLSQYGTYTNLDRITFFLWFNVHSKQILGGKQILFSFVDGYNNLDSFLNLMVYYQKDKFNQYTISISNDKINPAKKNLKLPVSIDLAKGFWNHLLVSIDQTQSDSIINIKFFSLNDQVMIQTKDIFPQQKFRYSFGPHSRITNEQLYEQTTDFQGCLNIAKFYYINGWFTLDSEIHADYDVDLKFLLRPYNTALNNDKAKLIKYSQGIENSGYVGINIYKNTQIIYNFNQLSSFTIGFWMQVANIISEFQFLSLTDDLIQRTSMGFGVDKFNNILLYQFGVQNKIIQTIQQKIWYHVTVGVLEISFDENLVATNKKKLIRIFLDDKEVSLMYLENLLSFTRLVIGPIKLDNKRTEVIDIQDIKIFHGFGIIKSDGDCSIFVGEYCLYCKSGTHYCSEQNPLDDTFLYECPAGYKNTIDGCIPLPQPNCLRVLNTNECCICKDGYVLQEGNCMINSQILYQPYSCTDINAQYCEQQNQKQILADPITNILSIVNNKKELSKLCKPSINKYDPVKFICDGPEVSNCQQSQYLSNCYKCKQNFYLAISKKCFERCAKNGQYKFRNYDTNDGQCIQYCPKRYLFSFTCTKDKGYLDYYCDPRDSCGVGEIDLKYTCVKQEQSKVGKSVGCMMVFNRYSVTIQIKCKSICKYCFGTQESHCLGCYAGFYFTPFLSTCLRNCSQQSNRFIYHNKQKMLCEYECPFNLLYENNFCVQQCSVGYAQYQNKCLPINQDEFYLSIITNKMNLCPDLCSTCSSDQICSKCINTYPMNNVDKCVFNCYPAVGTFENDLYFCKQNCEPDELIYDNPDFLGYPIKQCFKYKCGTIQADGVYQTFKHQIDPKLCVLPCDDGYFGSENSFSCTKCSDTCAKCQNIESYCTECYPPTFLMNNACFENCGDKYNNYVSFQCEGSCSSGIQLLDTSIDLKACVPKCGDIYPDYKFMLNSNCISEPPQIGVYCDGYNCDYCSDLCKTCTGPLDTNCSSCHEDYFFNANSCVKDCGLLKYDKINWQCVTDCPINLYQSQGFELINDVTQLVTTCFITCLYNLYQFQGQCYISIPNNCYCEKKDQFYFCGNCSQLCLDCTSAYSNSCTKCSTKAFLYGTTCFYDCPEQAPLKDIPTNTCVTQCSGFSFEGYCVNDCEASAYINLIKKECYASGCQPGTFNEPNTNYCYSCYQGCSYCLDATNNSCQSCFEGYYLDQGKSCVQKCQTDPNLVQDQVNRLCVQTCPVGSYLQSLPDQSLACRYVCPKYYYSNICVSECPQQTYLNGLKCLSCAGPCSVCFGTQVNQCTQCDQGFYKDGTTCYQICPQQKPYIKIVDQVCVENCLDYLYLQEMICFQSCPTFLYKYELNNKKECVQQCYQQSYLENGQCLECDPICLQCFGPDNGNCLQCLKPYYLYKQTCQLTCPMFYDTIENRCRNACPVDLVAQNNLCQQQCDEGYLIYKQNCLNSCPNFAFKKGNTCQDCNLVCTTCFGPTEKECTSCIENYYLNNTTCQLICDKFYDNVTQQCKENCNGSLELTDQKQCVTICPAGYINCESKCIKILPDGYYSNGIKCFKCNDKCQKCISSTNCTECKQNYYLESNQCKSVCSNKYLFMDVVTKSCVTKCSSSYYHLESFDKRFCVQECKNIIGNWCTDICPVGMYSENKECKACQQNCKECDSFTNCIKCLDGFYNENDLCLTACIINLTDRFNIKCVMQCDPILYQYEKECLQSCPTNPLTYQYKQTCHTICPNGTYMDMQQCYDCHISCTKCIGPSQNDCLICAEGYYLENQLCTKTCSKLYDKVNKKCVNVCPNNMFQELNNCVTICSKFSFKETCVDQCPVSTYATNIQCIDCPNNCIECNSSGCLKCQPPTYLLDGLCEMSCPVIYDDTQNECVDFCPEKTIKFFNYCSSECPINTFELENECQLSCPKYMIAKKNKCVKCPERCNECLDDTICNICQNEYYLYDGQCYVTCPLIKPFADITNGVCLSQCTPNTYVKQYKCVKTCDLIIHQNQCLEKCPPGYYGKDICKLCRLECKECSDYDICTKCNDNYFLEFNQCDTQCTKIKDIQKKQCVDSCDSLLYKNICYASCPINTYQFNNICIIKCHDGYYDSDQWQCEKCSNKCSICTTLTNCSKCRTGYFLHQNECLEECPSGQFGNPILNQCQKACPFKTYTYLNQCLFNCPDNYYNDVQNFKCVQNCSIQQYLINNTCYQCSIECDGCYADGNNNCLRCAANFKFDENGYCQGQNCKVGYFKSENSCKKCQHKCLTCENINECTQCRGNNRKSSDCLCEKGYYDNEFYDNCQKCPCDECTSEDNCSVCKNNLQLPKCTCERYVNEEWCVSCSVAKVEIKFSEDLNQIIIYFGYLVTVDLINPFKPSDCSIWFDNSDEFGTNSTCYLSWDRYSIIINLKPYASINVGDQLIFKQNFYRDIDQGLCDEEFISTFIENKVLGPDGLIKPHIEFSIPSYVSACKEIEIKQILLSGTAQRLQKVLSWQLASMENEENYLQMETFLAQQSNEILIPINTLQPNTTYKIIAKYINILQRTNYTTFSFTTIPKQATYVFLTFDPLIANVYVFDCHISFSDMTNSLNIQIDIVNKEDPLISYISQLEQINSIYKVQLNETLIPKDTPVIFRSSTGSSIIIENFILKSKEIDIQFLQKNRFIGLDNQINARGYDRNIQDVVLSTKNMTYQWLCTNLHNLQPCKTDENKIMQFPSTRVVNIYPDSQNMTLVFYVKASKQNRWNVNEHMIVMTDFNIEEEFHYNDQVPENYINPNDEITILMKNQQKYAFIIQKHKVILSQKIKGSQLKFRLSDYSIDIVHPIYIHLVPGKESIAFKLNNPPPKIIFTIFPLKGKALDYFNYTIENLNVGSSISIYYYFDNQTLENEIKKQQASEGIPLIINSNEISGKFQLPNGLSENLINLLCQVTAEYGAKSFFKQQVQVERQNYQLSNLISEFSIEQNNTNGLNGLHTMITIIQLEQEQVCLKQCSGVGTCINQKCECPPGYYFDDCSGDQQQYSYYQQLLQTSQKQLVKQNISNNDDFKLFTQTLHYLSRHTEDIEGFTIEDCQYILKKYISNTNSRLEQINQYQLNLQFYSNGDFNFSQIDIRSVANYNDLNNALESIVFIWNKTIFQQDSNIYQLQSYLQQFMNNIIDLSLISISYDQKIEYFVDYADIKIQKTSNLNDIINLTNTKQTRVLLTDQEGYYDVILAVYIRNFYALDGYFPYPDQIYPLYDYSIRNSNKKQNIELSNNISYRFGIQNNTFNLVCLTRNATTYYWQNDYCYIDNYNFTYTCNCSILAPTTIVNDLKYIYQGQQLFYIILPNIFYQIYCFQIFILIIVIYKAKNQNSQNTENFKGSYKYGHVFKLLKNKQVFAFNKFFYEAQPQSHTFNHKNDELLKINSEYQQLKFHFNQFWKYHVLTSIIYNQKPYLSLPFRIIQQIIKMNVVAILGQFLVLLNISFIKIFPILISLVIVLRIIETYTKRLFKYLNYLKSFITLFAVKSVLIFTFLGSLILLSLLNFQIDNQTELIISYTASNLIDWLIVNISLFTAKKFLGQEMKKQIRDKLQIFKQQTNRQSNVTDSK